MEARQFPGAIAGRTTAICGTSSYGPGASFPDAAILSDVFPPISKPFDAWQSGVYVRDGCRQTGAPMIHLKSPRHRFETTHTMQAAAREFQARFGIEFSTLTHFSKRTLHALHRPDGDDDAVFERVVVASHTDR